jgi:hypothetical protein
MKNILSFLKPASESFSCIHGFLQLIYFAHFVKFTPEYFLFVPTVNDIFSFITFSSGMLLFYRKATTFRILILYPGNITVYMNF